MSTLKQRFAELQADMPNISQADLARATGAKPPSVNAWFTGDTKSMKAGTADKAAALYGVNALWLATGEGYKMPIRDSSSVSISNQDVASVQKAQAAISNIATLEQSLEGLAYYMAGLDDSDRRAAMRMIDGLAEAPDRHAKTAAGIRAMVGAAFVQSTRKAA
jgi:hypothetical protein